MPINIKVCVLPSIYQLISDRFVVGFAQNLMDLGLPLSMCCLPRNCSVEPRSFKGCVKQGRCIQSVF